MRTTLQHLVVLAIAFAGPMVSAAVSNQNYNWKNVKTGGGGGFTPGIIFNPTEKGLAYARTDIGGAYKLNSDDTWTPLLDFADNARWNYWGVDALATDPVEPKRLYLATGLYTNSWDGNGQILISSDYGKTFTASSLPFKVGGNMPGRGMGERLAVDPNSNGIIYFGARSGNGLWKSTNYGQTWSKVTAFPSTGTYVPDPSDSSGLNSDKIGISFVTFDSTSGSKGSATPRIFVGVANKGSTNLYVSTNAGASWSAVAGQPTTNLPHKGKLSPKEKVLYISYADGAGPYDGTAGEVWKYNIATGAWTNITPSTNGDCPAGFGGLTVDLQKPGTLMVATLNCWWPDAIIFRSTDSGATWSRLWTWKAYPEQSKHYTYSNANAPWLGVPYVDASPDSKQIGWMIESMEIDPLDSNHWLYGTGASVFGGRDLLKWDSSTNFNITLKSLASGIEETAVLGLISPPTGPPLVSAIGDITGFVHDNLDVAPKQTMSGYAWYTTVDIDFAGTKPTAMVHTSSSSDGKQVYVSTDSGKTWSRHSGAPDGQAGSKVAISADGSTILWRTSSGSVQVSSNNAQFTSSSGIPSNAVITSDKKDNTFYGGSGSTFYASTDNGKTFSSKASLNGTIFEIASNPATAKDIWVSTDKGLFRTTNLSSFTAISGVTQAWSIALGAPKSSGGYPAVFILGTINGASGVYRSDDQGANWFKINDAAHGFASLSADTITADPRKYGRIYIGTNGRGAFYGDIA